MMRSSWLAALGQHALLDGLAVMVSDTMARGIGPSLAELNIPIVVLDGEINGVEHDTVVIDQRQGAQAMMEHLLEDCHDTRVIFVGGLETNIDTQARYQAYCDTLRKAKHQAGRRATSSIWTTPTSRPTAWQ